MKVLAEKMAERILAKNYTRRLRDRFDSSSRNDLVVALTQRITIVKTTKRSRVSPERTS
jgi:hypothetical protein